IADVAKSLVFGRGSFFSDRFAPRHNRTSHVASRALPWLAAAFVTVATVTGVVTPPAAAGLAAPDPEYLTLVRRYAAGDLESISMLAVWPESRVRTAVEGLRSTTSTANLATARSAAMLHTDVAYSTDVDKQAYLHLGLAQSLLPYAKA